MRAEDAMDEQHFRFRRCSPQRLAAARWQLFEFDEIRDVRYGRGDVVVVRYEGEQPRTKEWVAFLAERGFVFEPLVRRPDDLDAA
jgi:hypothetical protein